MKTNGLTDDASFSLKGKTLKNRGYEFIAQKRRQLIEQGVGEGIRRVKDKPYCDRKFIGG